MASKLEVKVCRKCGWKNKRVRKALKSLDAKHSDALDVRMIGCLDRCKKDPVVKVGKTCLAPAKPKRLKKLVEDCLV